MLTVKVPLKEAEKVKKRLMQKDIFLRDYGFSRDEDFIYFPIKERFGDELEYVEKDLQKRPGQGKTLKEALSDVLPPEVLSKVKTSYDTVGEIAILEIDRDLKEYDSLIGETLLSSNKKIKTVLAKDASHEGVFRTQKMRFLAGIDTRVALHKENGVVLEVDVEKVYFSTRLSTERKRIAELVRPGEKVLVCFSGCAPYPCVLGKKTSASKIVGVEINPEGHRLGLENVKRNKLTNVELICGDVLKVIPDVVDKYGTFDRVLMPLPKSAEDFLDTVIPAVRKGGMVHFYAFLHRDEFSKAHNWIGESCKRLGRSFKILDTVKCGQHAPYTHRICVDFMVD